MAIGLASIAAGPARAGTELLSISVSPDITAIFDSLEVRDHQVFVDDLQGNLTPIAVGALPESVSIDALHDYGNGTFLVSLDAWAELGGLLVRPADIVRWDGSQYTHVFTATGLPPAANVDAVTAAGTDLLLSFDRTLDLPGGPYTDQDLVRWNGTTFSLALDGDAFGIPEAVGIDAAHHLLSGDLLLSFDTAGSVGGVAFADEDVLELRRIPASWELVYDSATLLRAWARANLEALSATQRPDTPLFEDGFESGNTTAWSSIFP